MKTKALPSTSLEFTSVDGRRITLAIMTERREEGLPSVPFRADRPGRLDESAPIPTHRLSARGEPGAAGAVGETAPSIQRGSAAKIGRQSKTPRAAAETGDSDCDV